MKFGVREICDVVLRAKANQKVGNKIFYKDEPVIYFDTLKTSSMEGAATTVYAQGGRGNARLMAWEGERTITFTMEDALISPVGFSILSGAGLTEAKTNSTVKVHKTEQIQLSSSNFDSTNYTITLGEVPCYDSKQNLIYVMVLDDNGEVTTEPYIFERINTELKKDESDKKAKLKLTEAGNDSAYLVEDKLKEDTVVLVDYYVEYESNAQQIEITPDKFGGNYYLEASTLFRDTNGVDMPAEFIIPNCKIQSNFTFTMASSGDPSTFTFTMDAFPDYTRFDKTKKVLAAIQIISETSSEDKVVRENTPSAHNYNDKTGMIEDTSIDIETDEEDTPKFIIVNGVKYTLTAQKTTTTQETTN